MSNPLTIKLGVKTDPIEYRYSYPWLFNLLAEEGIEYLQIGTFFELYQLPDVFFRELAGQASEYGLQIKSMFTAHRELGGFFREESGWECVARRNYERLIEVGALLGAGSVGSNPGALLRDRMPYKDEAINRYLYHMRELMVYAYEKGVDCLTIEPMSCLAEPPTLPGEISLMARQLTDHHHSTPGTSRIGFCTDISHGYVDQNGTVIHSHQELMEATFPLLEELHLKNTDARYDSTFGFTEKERARGIIDLAEIRDILLSHAAELPYTDLIAYLEIGGPKLGRDYSDHRLESSLRESLRFIKTVFSADPAPIPEPAPAPELTLTFKTTPLIEIAPSLMCSDFCHLEESVRELERVGSNWLHLDIMDARFTPNMPIGFEVLRQLRPKTELPFDAHLMVMDNDFFVRELLNIGVQRISVHAESSRHLDRTLTAIRNAGVQAGVALNPATPLNTLDYVLERIDFILIMTVNPGFAGQQIVPMGIRKIADCSKYLKSRGIDIPIQVDGHVSFDNIAAMVASGADCLVAGTSSLFHPGDTLPGNMLKMQIAVGKGIEQRGKIDHSGNVCQ